MAERRAVMLEMFKSFWADESGQGLAEYAVLITLIAIVLFTAIVLFRDAIINVFNRITSILNTGS
jgi:Flp pilus assembly pilin Flp